MSTTFVNENTLLEIRKRISGIWNAISWKTIHRKQKIIRTDLSSLIEEEISRRAFHGNDKNIRLQSGCTFSLREIKGYAVENNGKCLSKYRSRRDLRTPLLFECQNGHQFWASPELVLNHNQWCEEC